MRSALAAGLALALVLGAAGCHTRLVPVPVMVVGPMRGEASAAMFARIVQAARAEGYQPLRVDVRYGSFGVRPRAGAQGISFEVQCFGDGRVQVRIAGADRSPSTGIVLVPVALRNEAMRFVEVLDAGGGGPP